MKIIKMVDGSTIYVNEEDGERVLLSVQGMADSYLVKVRDYKSSTPTNMLLNSKYVISIRDKQPNE